MTLPPALDRPMPLDPYASDSLDPKHPRAMALPKASANMKTFTPDSSIASDVIPSANFGDRVNLGNSI